MRKLPAQSKQTSRAFDTPIWLSGPALTAALRAGETCAAWNGEVLRFANDRLRQDTELGVALSKCRSWTEAAELQRDWATRTTQDYFEEGNRLLRLASQWGSNISKTASEET